ncbi:transposase [Streptomyces sp. BR123]|nr:transposase [Streptomyces sp. BR123]
MTDAQWARIEPLLPDRTPRRGGRWRDHRQVIDAIAFKYRTGTPWMDLPEHFGSWKGAHNRLRKWAADGTWAKVFPALLAQADAEGDLDWVVAVDSTIVRRAFCRSTAAGVRGWSPASPPISRRRESRQTTASTAAVWAYVDLPEAPGPTATSSVPGTRSRAGMVRKRVVVVIPAPSRCRCSRARPAGRRPCRRRPAAGARRPR